jgi:hypothetical protein
MLAITRFMLAITEIYMFSHGHNGHCGGMLPLLRFMVTTEICVLSCTAILIAVVCFYNSRVIHILSANIRQFQLYIFQLYYHNFENSIVNVFIHFPIFSICYY